MRAKLARLLVDDTGQDIIEYALLGGLIGTAGALVLPSVVDAMSVAYTSWVRDVNDAWEPCPPGGCGS